MRHNEQMAAPISQRLIDEIRSFPLKRSVQHCDRTFFVSPFAIYATCPQCAASLKVRSFSGETEIEDVFDAVFEWMTQPGALPLVQERQEVIIQDADDT
jgi:hypothetical protein